MGQVCSAGKGQSPLPPLGRSHCLPWASCPVTEGPLSPSARPPLPPRPSSAGLRTPFGTRPPLCSREQSSRRVPSMLSSRSSLRRSTHSRKQELISCISCAASLNCKRHPIFWKLNSDNKNLCCSQEPSLCALAVYMFVLSLDDGRNSLARMKIQRDGAKVGTGRTDVWQLRLQPPDADACPLSYPAALAAAQPAPRYPVQHLSSAIL